MCGIFGSIGSFISYEKAIKICSLLKHRGPDDGNVWLDKKNKVCIGQRRLRLEEFYDKSDKGRHGKNSTEL